MELKHKACPVGVAVSRRLNRTFYGIETKEGLGIQARLLVLIVPFMELKPKWR